MTDEELIKTLRDADAYNLKHYVRDPLHTPAANRIEALVKDNHRWKMGCEEFWRKREDAAEAKLAKAVGVLMQTEQAIMECTDEHSWRLWGEVAVSNIRAALAELDQQKDTNATA